VNPVALVCAIGFCFFSVTDRHAPAAISVLPCRNANPSVRRVQADFGVTFDISENDFNVRTSAQDMPPGRFYLVTLRNSSADMLIAHKDGTWPDLKNAFPTFSRRVKSRKILTVGKHSTGLTTGGI
jgi:hypothetical protein